jgi:hypothetical protein
LALTAAVALADIQSYDCKMKQLGLNFVQTLQPFRSQANFQVRLGLPFFSGLGCVGSVALFRLSSP